MSIQIVLIYIPAIKTIPLEWGGQLKYQSGCCISLSKVLCDCLNVCLLRTAQCFQIRHDHLVLPIFILTIHYICRLQPMMHNFYNSYSLVKYATNQSGCNIVPLSRGFLITKCSVNEDYLSYSTV